ncbi:kinetochore protein Spc24 [Brachyhypopomus gauderio]|uniref:kinetochore protein Spc24 n=1 Tax=Brachyhypopomus gauderio TaxID=698409 RepID=UPI004041FA47
MLQNDALDHDLENTGEMVIKLIESSKAEDSLRAARKKQQVLFEHHLETKKTATQLLNSLVHSEELVGQKLLDLKDQNTQMTRELEKVEKEVQQIRSKSLTLDSDVEFLQKELERLKESEKEIQTLQQEVDEDTTEVIPSAIYLAQLYLKITGIKLELDTEPHILRGVHYGANVATPIDIDTSTRSPCEISDELWSLVSTDW